MQPVLEVSRLTKHYGSYVAVNNISFSIGEGEIVGLLGPNGAGKTTTMQILLGLTTPTSGSVRYFGKDFATHRAEILAHINFASAYTQIQGRLTVMENMRIFAGLYEVPNAKARIAELLQLLEIEGTANSLFWTLSSGQKTRVVLAKSLLNRPKLILMDEPTASLDPDIANKVLDLILELQKKEKLTMLITSHDMSEVEELCDRVMFLDHGNIVAEDTPLGLTKKIGKATLIVTFDTPQAKIDAYLTKQKVHHEFVRDHVVSMTLVEKEIPKVLFGLSSQKIDVTDIDIEKPNLEDVFLSVAKGKYEY
jgi:ABC-2 type transport system ATP-binding protein